MLTIRPESRVAATMAQNSMGQNARSQAALNDGKLHNLRRTFTPYIGQTFIFSAVTLFLLVVACRGGQWSLLWGAAVIWPLYAIIVLIGLRCRVLYDDTGVIMRASGGPDRHIRFDEISEIKYEIGATESRPIRRLVILGGLDVPDAFIDVSLRHFRLDDIQKLLSDIHEHLPELSLPAIPLN